MNQEAVQKDQNVSFITSLWRSQATSLIASLVDMSIFSLCFYVFSIFYPMASGIGAFCGAIVSFFLGRQWAFESTDDKMIPQMIRYACASGLSLILNVYGIYFFVETFGLDEFLSKLLTSVIIGIFINFPIFRYWVFRDRK